MKTMMDGCIFCPAYLFCGTGTQVLLVRCSRCVGVTCLGFARSSSILPFSYCPVSEFDNKLVEIISVCALSAAKASFKLASYTPASTPASECLACSPWDQAMRGIQDDDRT